MIITVSLNPAVDRYITVRDFSPGGLNRVLYSRSFSGGKGNNVASVLHRMGVPCLATGFMSGNAGRGAEAGLADQGIRCAFVYTSGETRTNIKITDESSRSCTELNESGPPASSEDLTHLEKTLKKRVQAGDVVVFSGSLPEGIEPGAYARLMIEMKKQGARTVLDADDEALGEGLRSSPEAIKPNIDELSRLAGRILMTPEEIIAAVREIRKSEDQKVLVSMGDRGAMLFGKVSVLYAQAPDVSVVNTVGAGDAMTAALAIGLSSGADDETLLRRSVAFAAASVMSEHFECLTEEYVIGNMDKIRIRRL